MMKYFILFSFSFMALAAGDGHGAGSVADLIPNAINLGILVVFLIWKLRTPLKNYFVNISKEMKSSMDSAEAKSKEAKIKYELNKSKLDNLNNEISKIDLASEDEREKLESEFIKELDLKILHNLADTKKRLELEKEVALNQLGQDVLDKIILDCKTNIAGDSGHRLNAENKVVEGLK